MEKRSTRHNDDDSIFVAIEAHKAAAAEETRAMNTQNQLVEQLGISITTNAYADAVDAENRAFKRLCNIKPRTAVALAQLVSYVLQVNQEGIELNGRTFPATEMLLESIAKAARAIGRQQA